MITSIMAFLAIVGAIAAVGAWGVEEGLRRTGLHRARWVWLAALAMGPALLAVGILAWFFDVGSTAESANSLPGGLFGNPILLAPLVSGSSSWLSALPEWTDLLLGTIWLTSAAVGTVFLVRSARSLREEMESWTPVQALGRSIRVSRDHGPAVAGLRTPLIVVPSWALALDEARLELILKHEEEHVRAADPRTVAMGLLLALLSAWNPITWWQWRRLRAAAELDCDARVLASSPDTRQYGEILIQVARRCAPISPALAAFSERGSSLQRRILTMTISRSARSIATGTLLLVAGASLAVVACDVPMPLAPRADATEAAADGAPQARTDAEIAAEPSFTPFTVKPDVKNRAEVVAALEREYPPLLRDAGIGGTVEVWFFIDRTGGKAKTLMKESSGHAALDAGALAVAGAIEFTPALNGSTPVPVWIALPITFQTR